MFDDEDKPKIKVPFSFKAVLGVIALLFIAIMLSGFIVNIEPGQEGVLIDKTAGGVQPIALTPGWHFKTPITQEIVSVEIATQKEETVAYASSKDLQDVNTTVAVNYRPNAGSTPRLYNEVGLDYRARIIDPVIQESVKAVTAQFTAEELITKRETVKGKISEDIKLNLKNYNIMIDGVFITNFRFSPEFTNAIEQKQIAEQNALKANNDLNRIKIEADQKVVSAKAEAEAIKITGDALKQNPSLIQLEWVKKWDGKMPLYNGGESNVLVPTPTKG
jgi:regulator of protease activity HflC (stomatin/prohibitin superfamily)